MTANTRWTMSASREGPVFATLLRNKRRSAKPTPKAEVQQWENEGGNLAPAPEAKDTLASPGSI